jgi:hypothetical protein
MHVHIPEKQKRGERKVTSLLMKFGLLIVPSDIINNAYFGFDRLWGFCSGRIECGNILYLSNTAHNTR